MKFLQWNSRSASHNKDDLLATTLRENIDIILLSETWLKQDQHFNFNRYHVLRQDRHDGKGGAAVLIKNKIPFKLKHIQHTIDGLQIVCIETKVNNSPIQICSIYAKPAHRITTQQWKAIYDQLNTNVIIAGDFNAHSVAWGSTRDSFEGNQLRQLVEDERLIVLNDRNPTTITQWNRLPAILDLTICSPVLAPSISWRVGADPMGSDHLPIFIEMSPDVRTQHLPRDPTMSWSNLPPRWKIVDWDFYNKRTELGVTHLQSLGVEAPTLDNMIDLIYDAAEDSTPSRARATHSDIQNRRPTAKKRWHNPTPWWDSDCSKAVAYRRLAMTHYRKYSTKENYMTLQRAQAVAKRTLKLKKKQGWRDYCSSINQETKMGDVWTMIRRYRAAMSVPTPKPLSVDWIEDFHKLIAPDMVPFSHEGLQERQQASTTSRTNQNQVITDPLTLDELEGVLDSLPNKSAPGYDGISYPMLQHLAPRAKVLLLRIFQDLLRNGQTHRILQTQLTVPILKPSKDPALAQSYRPIALLSCVGKVLERLLKRRLDYWCESNNVLPRSQFGGRSGRSTIDSLNILNCEIQQTYSQHKYLVVTTLDIHKAFDNVQLHVLISKLQAIGLPSILTCWLQNYLSNRIIHVKHTNSSHQPRSGNMGLPQGSSLSPLLFSIYTSEIDKLLDPYVKVLQFIDDLIVMTSAFQLETALTSMVDSMEEINNKLNTLGLTLSKEKTKCIIFTKHRLAPFLCLRGKGFSIPITNHVRILGATFDTKSTWSHHITKLVATTSSQLNILRALTTTWWGADPYTLIILYKSLVRSQLDYGCQLYAGASTSQLGRLDKIQNQAIRICMGAMKSTPLMALHRESTILPLSFRREALMKKYILKAISIQTHQLIPKLQLLQERKTRFNRNIPASRFPILENFEEIYPLKDKVHRTPKVPIYHTRFTALHGTGFIKVLAYPNGTDTGNTNTFSTLIDSTCRGTTIIYTDGSKIPRDNHVGAAFAIPEQDIYIAFKLPKEASIFTAEAVAIAEALTFISHHRVEVPGDGKYLIMTDSQSIVAALNTKLKLSHTHMYILKIANMLDTLRDEGIRIQLAWIRGHMGIEGNEMADTLAKNASIMKAIKLPYTDFIQPLQDNIWEKWATSCFEHSTNHESHYNRIANSVLKRPWFQKAGLPRIVTTSIFRMRTGHCCIGQHLFRIHAVPSPSCECGHDVQTLNHIFFECPLHDESRKPLLKSLLTLKIPRPFNIPTLLCEINFNVFTTLVRFLHRSGLNI